MKEGKWNPLRVLQALGRIGYHPVSAVLDMVDNSVSSDAENILIKVVAKKDPDSNGKKKAIMDAFIIVDDGTGMDEALLDNALSLGSSEEFYDKGTLSKFGMGLKSAASSLGKRLTIITRQEGTAAIKAVLDQDVIASQGSYVYDVTPPEQDEVNILNDHVGGDENKAGTIIIIDKIHHESMPSVAEIITGLQRKAGIVYFYYLIGKGPSGNKISIQVNGESIEPFDPLFVEEIDKEDGNLDENNWNGRSVEWIHTPKKIQLDIAGQSVAEVAMTQLPHPPTVADSGEMGQKACRDKYMIGAGNYGFYIYRNGRLISWADSLEMVGQNQDLYSFRGRLLISSDADKVLNIDVTKSRIHLSEIARDQLVPLIQEAKKKSIVAWNTAKRTLDQKTSKDPHSDIASELDKIGDMAEKNDSIDEDVLAKADREKLKDRRKKATESKKTSQEESEKLEKEGQRVQYVPSLENNQLWERAHDAEQGLIVRVNSSHRMCRDIVDTQTSNSTLLKMLDILFFSLARGEYSLIYKSDFDQKLGEKVMEDFRERVGNELSEIVKKIDLSKIINNG